MGLDCKLAKDGLEHDLRNAFQTIRQAAALVAFDDAHAGTAASIVRAVDHAERILGLRDSFGPVSLRDTAARAVEYVRAESAGLSFRFEGPDVRVLIPAAALERALANLFVNAVQAAAAGGTAWTEVVLRGCYTPAGYALTVADNGPGIPATLLDQVFTPRLSGHSGGEGLGLYVVRAALAECGATIRAANGESGGAVFTVLFPADALVRVAAAGAGGSVG
jgi:two-component system, NtrC family, C4-dicarboxylate transport sensor histidine kinase DctB